MLTLNQTIEIFKNFSLKHKALGKGTSQNNFYFGNEWEVEAASKVQYPLMWVSLLPTKAQSNGLITRKFQIDFSDLVKLDESNENHVLSDTEAICFDLINYLNQISNEGEIIIAIGEPSEITDYTEKRDSAVSGWYFTIEISSHLENASCNLPIIAGDIFDGNYIYLSGSTGTGCSPVIIKDQDGNTLQTFTSGGIYTVTIVSAIDGGNATTVFTNTVIGN